MTEIQTSYSESYKQTVVYSTELSRLRITARYLYYKLTLLAGEKIDDENLAKANHVLRDKYLAAERETYVLRNDTEQLQSGFDHYLEEEEDFATAIKKMTATLANDNSTGAHGSSTTTTTTTTTKVISGGSSSTSTTTSHKSSSSSSSSSSTTTSGKADSEALEVDAQPETTESSISSAGAAGITVAGLVLGASAFALYKKRQAAKKDGLDSFLMQE